MTKDHWGAISMMCIVIAAGGLVYLYIKKAKADFLAERKITQLIKNDF